MNYEQIMKQARATNRKRDASDRKHGLAAPSDVPLVIHLQTVMFAIEAGIKRDDWGCVAEAQGMLEEIMDRLKG